MNRIERLAAPLIFWRDRFGHRWWYWFITIPVYGIVCFYLFWFAVTFAMFVGGLATVRLYDLVVKYWQIVGPPPFPFIR